MQLVKLYSRTVIWALASLLVFGTLSSCKSSRSAASGDDGQIEIAFVQLNDVYEIAGVDGGKVGDLSRVAHYWKKIRQKYPASMMVHAGDFLNPSLIGTLRYQGERIKGKQMVEVMNVMGIDLAVFGNHEFDLDEEDLQKRIDESTFDWISTNTYQACGDKVYPFYKNVDGKKQFFPESKVYTFSDADGTTARIGFFTGLIAANPVPYVRYYDPDSCAAIEIKRLKEASDIIIGLTHLSIDQDLALARKQPEVKLIMGGHEHDNMFHKVGDATVAKADANAKTVYLHVVGYNKKTGKISVNSDLIEINEKMPKDPEVEGLIRRWNAIMEENVKQIIPEPYEVVYHADPPLDGKESTIRHQQANMGRIFTQAMLEYARHNPVAAVMNSGSIRIDDEISGEIVAIDIIRALPFHGSLWEVTMKGKLLTEVLDFSENSKGSGAYLQYNGIDRKGDAWYIQGKPVQSDQDYLIAINDFLLKGYDIPFLKEGVDGISTIYKPDESDQDDLRNDVRKMIITYLKTLKD